VDSSRMKPMMAAAMKTVVAAWRGRTMFS